MRRGPARVRAFAFIPMDLVSPHAFWLLKNGLLRSFPSLRDSVRCDVAVLGGGISGALIAETLSEAGLDVIVLEKRDIGGGSTCASTALISYELDSPLRDLEARYGRKDAELIYQMSRDSVAAIGKLIAKRRIACGCVRKPSVYLAVRPHDALELRKESHARSRIGIESHFLDQAEVEKRFSFSRPGAVLSPDAAQLDPHKLTHALITLAEKNGARIFDRVTVTGVSPQRSGVRISTESGPIVRSSHVVFATGYESGAFLPKQVADLRSTYAIATAPLASTHGWWKECMLWESSRPYLYIRSTEDGRALIGGEDDHFHSPKRRDREVERKGKRLAAKFRAMFPCIPFQKDYAWAGTFAETKDGLPYIGSIAQMPRCHFALGFGGNGVSFSMLAATIIRERLTKGRSKAARLFRFDR